MVLKSKTPCHSTAGNEGAFLIEAFRERSDDEGRTRVARLIGRIGLTARAAAPQMRQALQDPQTSAAGQAAYALGRMRAREALPDIVRAAKAGSAATKNEDPRISGLVC